MYLSNSFFGTVKVKRIDKPYGTLYFAQMFKRDKDGRKLTADKRIIFPNGIELFNGQEIEIIKATETFSIKPNRQATFYLYCSEFKTVVDNKHYKEDTGKVELTAEDFEEIDFKEHEQEG